MMINFKNTDELKRELLQYVDMWSGKGLCHEFEHDTVSVHFREHYETAYREAIKKITLPDYFNGRMFTEADTDMPTAWVDSNDIWDMSLAVQDAMHKETITWFNEAIKDNSLWLIK